MPLFFFYVRQKVEARKSTTSRLGFVDDAQHDEGLLSSGSALLPDPQPEGRARRDGSGKVSQNIYEEAGRSHSFETTKAGPLKRDELSSAIKMESFFARGRGYVGILRWMEEAFLAWEGENDDMLSEWTKEAVMTEQGGDDAVVFDAWKLEVEKGKAAMILQQHHQRARREGDGRRSIAKGHKVHAVFDFADADEGGGEEREGRAKMMEGWDVDLRESSTESAPTVIHDYGYGYAGFGGEMEQVRKVLTGWELVVGYRQLTEYWRGFHRWLDLGYRVVACVIW